MRFLIPEVTTTYEAFRYGIQVSSTTTTITVTPLYNVEHLQFDIMLNICYLIVLEYIKLLDECGPGHSH